MKKWFRRIAAFVLFLIAALFAWKMLKGNAKAHQLADDIDRLKKNQASRKKDIDDARRKLEDNATKAARAKERVEKIRERVKGDLPSFDATFDSWMRRVDADADGARDDPDGGDRS